MERRGIEPTLTQLARRDNPHKCGEVGLKRRLRTERKSARSRQSMRTFRILGASARVKTILCAFALSPSSTVRGFAYRFLQNNVAVNSPNANAIPSEEYGCSRKTLSVATAPATACSLIRRQLSFRR